MQLEFVGEQRLGAERQGEPAVPFGQTGLPERQRERDAQDEHRKRNREQAEHTKRESGERVRRRWRSGCGAPRRGKLPQRIFVTAPASIRPTRWGPGSTPSSASGAAASASEAPERSAAANW